MVGNKAQILPCIKDMTERELGEFCQDLGQQKFRGKQIFQWIVKGVSSFEEMLNLPIELRSMLKEKACISKLYILEKQISKDGTQKYLLGTTDGHGIEAVLMRYKHGNTLCISSQIGCSMGCSFCGSTLGGKVRNLSAGEMMDQILVVQEESGLRINNIVIMGIGEPLDNVNNLFSFLEIVNSKNGLNIGLRNITISTCGLIEEIKLLGDKFPQVNLAISLHSAREELRKTMMPIEKKYPLGQLLKVCQAHGEKTGRRISFEYALIKGVNDGDKDVKKLIERLSKIHCHINLIPLNPVKERGLMGSNKSRAIEISKTLENAGIPTTIRRTIGADIDAACGQLRNKNLTDKSGVCIL